MAALVRVVALPKYPFMINYVVATNVERFVRFAFGHTSVRSTAPIHGASLGDQSIRRCAVPTGWFSELILSDYRSAAAGRRVIN